MSIVRVFLADDHGIVRDGLKALVNSQPDMAVCGEAGDGETAVAAVHESHPDVVVMDVSLPRMDGGAATERLRRDCPEVRVLALTVHEDTGYLKRMLEAGAAGYVLKRSATESLIAGIRAVARGEQYLDPALTPGLAGMVRSQDRQRSEGHAELSEREREVLRGIAQGHSNKEIAAKLGLSIKTVETYKARSLEKLGLRSRADIVRFAVRQGWLAESVT